MGLKYNGNLSDEEEKCFEVMGRFIVHATQISRMQIDKDE
jgi:hypothetical protein